VPGKAAVAAVRKEGFDIQLVDVNANRSLANKYRVRFVPTFVYVLDGKEVRRSSGMLSPEAIKFMYRPPLF